MSTTDAIYLEPQVFDGGPPLRLQRSLGLVKPGQPRVISRALLAAAISWLPLAILSTFFGSQAAKAFFGDFSVHGRYLLAVPALILAEADFIPKIEKIIRHFAATGLIPESEIDRYQQAVQSTRRLLDSTYIDVLAVLLAYLVVAAL
jgi:hypothetical protein